MFSLKKVLSVARENNLFSKNEYILIASTVVFTFAAFLFANNLRIDYQSMSYISSIGFLHVLILNIVWAYFAMASINKDISGRYIYFILKNVSRTEYILGKILSITWVLFLINLIFSAIFLAFYAFFIRQVDFPVLYAPAFQFLEAWVFSMFALAVTLISKNNIARIFALIAIYFLANSTYGIRVLIDQGAISFGNIGNAIFDFAYKVFPNFAHFNVRDVLPYDTSLGLMFGTSSLYAVLLVAITGLLSIWVFKKDNL